MVALFRASSECYIQSQHTTSTRRRRTHDVVRIRLPPPSRTSPLRTAEDMASKLGLEITIADLERLFRQAPGGHPPPPAADAADHGERPPVRVAYQGGRGSYCQEAAAKAFPPSSSWQQPPPLIIPCSEMEEAFAALEDGIADRAVVPAENSVDGPVPRNLDLLLRHPRVCIVGELVLPVNHCLLSLPQGPRSALRRVVSHPQAISHCRDRLRALHLRVEEVASAADAARFVAENCIADTAVIGSQIASHEFGLRVLENNFQDLAGNFNRFLQLGLAGSTGAVVVEPKLDDNNKKNHKTTVAFALERGVSDLFRAMWIFESRGVRVTRVDHRPNRSKPVRVEEAGEIARFDYVFVLDLEGTASDTNVQAGLARLNEIAGFARVLGSYTCTCSLT